tara:strand:+ start:255 stop:623 length:369 start_codon:yes stop_codon:yes gene_type:complete
MAISLGSASISALKLGSTSVSKAYLGSTLVFPTASGFATGTISVAGAIRTADGDYAATQFATSGSGSGATFGVTIVNNIATAFNINTGGAGYAVNDTVTLDITGVSAGFQAPRVELTVSTLG